MPYVSAYLDGETMKMLKELIERVGYGSTSQAVRVAIAIAYRHLVEKRCRCD